MVRITIETTYPSDKRYIEAFGLSTDSKPTSGVITGSVFVEVDTGKAFLFNETASAWVEVQ